MSLQILSGSPRRLYLLLLSGALILVWHLLPLTVWGRADEPRVLRAGLSRIQGTTLLTVVLNQAIQPQVFPITKNKSPRLRIIFPDALGFNLPPVLPGDNKLVRQIRTLASPGRKGVRIILELYPNRPYVFWRQMRPGPKGLIQFIIGLKPDAQAQSRSSPGLQIGKVYRSGGLAPSRDQKSSPPNRYAYRGGLPSTPAPWVKKRGSVPESYRYQDYRGQLKSEAFQQLGQLAPNAAGVLSFLEKQGWSVVQNDTCNRPGQRVIQKFLLTQSRYPQLTIRITHIAGTSAVSPDINFITLRADNLSGTEVERYRNMQHWSTKQIKQHYEDIGDYFDDGLKPLRVILRERSRAAALRNFDFFRHFLLAACPQEPQLADQILAKVKEKVNKRLEGVQYTISENPLVILNLVDFLFVRVYFLNPPT